MHMTEKTREELAREVAQLKTENIEFASALTTIIGETSDAEVVRIAMSALTNTTTGRDYLEANPMRF